MDTTALTRMAMIRTDMTIMGAIGKARIRKD